MLFVSLVIPVQSNIWMGHYYIIRTIYYTSYVYINRQQFLVACTLQFTYSSVHVHAIMMYNCTHNYMLVFAILLNVIHKTIRGYKYEHACLNMHY